MPRPLHSDYSWCSSAALMRVFLTGVGADVCKNTVDLAFIAHRFPSQQSRAYYEYFR